MPLWFKQNCLLCKQTSHNLICQFCFDDLDLFELPQHQFNLLNWPKVEQGLGSVSFNQLLSACDYHWPISELITQLKFQAKTVHAKALAELFYRHCVYPLPAKPQLIIPIPLHHNRYFIRKFNQSIEICKHLNKLSDIPFNAEYLARNKSTKMQSQLSASQRKRNLKNAFTVTKKGLTYLNNLTHIALFDDVITTGTTIEAAYSELKQHFPHCQIDIWSLCITLKG